MITILGPFLMLLLSSLIGHRVFIGHPAYSIEQKGIYFCVSMIFLWFVLYGFHKRKDTKGKIVLFFGVCGWVFTGFLGLGSMY